MAPLLDSPAMDCTEIQRSADALLDGEFDERERAEAAAHLAGCPACQGLVGALERTRTATREKLRAALGPGTPHGTAPPALRARLREALARERRPWWRRALQPLPVAAAVACAAGAVLVLHTHSGADDPLVEEAVARHARMLPLEITAGAAGADSVLAWFEGKVDFNARPPSFRDPDLRLVGGRISQIRDRPAAYMRYQGPHGQLGLFIIEDPDRRFAASGREFRAGPATVRLINARGYNVAVWRRDEIVYSLVSDVDERDLEGLVRATLAAGH